MMNEWHENEGLPYHLVIQEKYNPESLVKFEQDLLLVLKQFFPELIERSRQRQIQKEKEHE